MRLLICTQAVDSRDSDLGFFVRWTLEFAKQCESVEVLTLRRGDGAMPDNVAVHVLPRGRLARAASVLNYGARLKYDAVFVHMNPEYVVVAGLLWRLMGKKIALWYTHKSVDLKLRIATFLAHVVFTASKESFRIASPKVRVVGHGIDMDFFTPDPSVTRGQWALSVGRLAKSKRHDLAIRAAAGAGHDLRIAGEGPERESLEAFAHELSGARVQFLGGLTQSELRDEYRKAAYMLHTSETGSLDKVVLEAMACGLPVRTSDQALKDLGDFRALHSLPRLVREIVASIKAL